MRVFNKKQRSMGSHGKVAIFADASYALHMSHMHDDGVERYVY